MSTTAQIDLTRFVAAKDDGRAFLRAPFATPHGMAACNGHVAVITIGDVETATEDSADEGQVELIARLSKWFQAIAALPADGWIGLDQLAEAPHTSATCRQCKGKGRCEITTCPDCDGEGEFDHGRHTYQCRECDGAGSETYPTNDPKAPRCDECCGTGKSGGTQVPGTEAPQHGIATKYHHLLREAPNAQIYTKGFVADSRAFAVRFDGGCAIVMPVRL